MIAALEIGGTKVIAALANEDSAIIDRLRVPTTEPSVTLGACVDWLQERSGGHVAAIGVASFGPIRVDPRAMDFGVMLKTPKPHWTGANVLAPLHAAFPQARLVLDTDVNAAALAEADIAGESDLAYITVGTGIGAGILSGGRLIHGVVHPELGHLRVMRAEGDRYPGGCPFHGDCLEGLASGPAIAARCGQTADTLADHHPVWDFEADYLAQALLTLLATVSTRAVVIGGGVAQAPTLHERIERHLHRLAGGYFPVLDDCVAEGRAFVRAPHYGQDAGLRGALLLARQALRAD